MLADHRARRTGDSDRRRPLLISRRKGPQIAVLASFLALIAWSGPQYVHTQTAAAAAAITIGSTPGATINAQFDTQHVWPNIIAQQPVGTGGTSSFDRLNALNGSVLRIHAGTDATYAGTTCSNGVTPALPFNAAYTSSNGICVSPWDFRNLNSMILNSHDSGSGGTVTYAAASLTDSSKNWQPSIWMGRRVAVGSQSRIVADNTATTLTLSGAWSPAPSGGTAYTLPSVTGPTMINVRYLPDNMYGGTGPMGGNAAAQGGIADMTYQAYASYMATLVRYYNKGIAPPGANPSTPPPGVGPIVYWEIYNEPDFASENPRIPPTLPTPSGITLAGIAATGGTLTAGSTYTYQVAAVTTGDGAAHTAASAAQTVMLTAGQNAVQVKIPRSASAALGKIAPGYFIYGRSGTPQYIGFAGRDSNGGNDLVWVDKGTAAPSGAAPAANTTGGEAPFDPVEYKRMWDVVVPAMKAVDPTIKVVGPVATNPISIAGSSVVITTQTYSPGDGSWSDPRDYVQVLMTSANKPDVVSYHGYGGFQGSLDSEQSMFDAVDNPSNSDAIVQAVTSNILPYTGSTPLWHTETAPNAAFGDSRNLEGGAYGAAWFGHLFAHLSPLSPQLTDLFQYEFVNSPNFGLVAEPGTSVPGATAGDPYLPYWSIYEMNKNFPRGSKLLPVSNAGAGLDVLAALVPPDFKTVHVLVVNRQPAATCCAGATLSPTLALSGLTSSATSETIISSLTNLAGGPTTVNLGPLGTVSLVLAGYSIAVLEFKTGVPPPSACAFGGVTANQTSPQASGTAVTFTATAGGCGGTPEYEYWIYGQGSWTLAQAYSPSNT
ncbi:MAG TPA: hypothetical protein VJQ08_12595, partial [Candidatus Dormibacteraeota bacterium]|nr:hypothetical protein [Candidatus Dormibacteraeota bacterium]